MLIAVWWLSLIKKTFKRKVICTIIPIVLKQNPYIVIRGPLELHSLQRAVTAQDFELIATKQTGLVNRAHAYTKRSIWQYAAPGIVEVVLVPQVFGDQGPITPYVVVNNESPDVVQQIQTILNQRKSLGTKCIVSWCRYKSVKAKVSLSIHKEENREAVKARILGRLYNMLTPLAQHTQPWGEHYHPGWAFGKELAAYDIYRIISSEPGVKAVDPVTLEVSHVPDKEVSHIDADPWQNQTWYAATENALYRTLNNGDGWEQISQWQDEKVVCVKSFPRENQILAEVAGFVVVLTRSSTDNDNTLYLSQDCGETWTRIRKPDFIVNDVTWIERNGRPSLLIASEKGVFEQTAWSDAEWKPVVVDSDNLSLPARSIAVATSQTGTNYIVVATPPDTGVYLAVGPDTTFKNIGLKGKIVSVLKIQSLKIQRYLWAGLAAVGDDPGKGCYRWQLQISGDSAEGWKPINTNWSAGGCTSLTFINKQVYAGSKRLGVMTLQTKGDALSWLPSDVNSQLPMVQLNEFKEVNTVMAAPLEHSDSIILAGGPSGIFKRSFNDSRYLHCSQAQFNDRVTLPATWLFCSADHEVIVNYD